MRYPHRLFPVATLLLVTVTGCPGAPPTGTSTETRTKVSKAPVSSPSATAKPNASATPKPLTSAQVSVAPTATPTASATAPASQSPSPSASASTAPSANPSASASTSGPPAETGLTTISGAVAKQGVTQDGSATAARFNQVDAIALASDGTLLVVDRTQVRKISTDGAVKTLAGQPNEGHVDDVGTKAQFKTLMGIACTADGKTIYVADDTDHTIRKVVLNAAGNEGTVTTLAGTTGTSGNTNGVGTTNAKFNKPVALALSADESTLFVADEANHLIRKIELSSQTVSTFAGSGTAGFKEGTGTEAQFDSPGGVVCNTNGDVFVADTKNNRIRKITSTGVVSTLAGTRDSGLINGNGPSATFNRPGDLSLDRTGGNLFVVDALNLAIRRVNVTSGAVDTIKKFVSLNPIAVVFKSPKTLIFTGNNDGRVQTLELP